VRYLTLIALLIAASWPDALAGVPREAQQHRRELLRVAQYQFGLGAPVATLAAQVHQESGWRPGVRSHAGAEGMAQFMPGTSQWMSEIYPDLAPAAPFNPGWALRAMVRYDAWLLARVAGADACHEWAFALAGYNGGLGWVRRDVRLAAAAGADPLRWWDHVEHHTARADWARRENRGYVRLILRRWEPLYTAAGWGPGVCA
jgi:soluble lytic murein transglycosylase-like protein